MASVYKVIKSTHVRSSPSAKDKGSKLSKGDIVEVIDTERNGDNLWVQLDAGRWACAERGSEILLRAVSKVKVTVVQAKELLAMDSDGTSDPFFRLSIEDNKKKCGKKQETPVVNDTLTPKYTNTEKCSFEFAYGESDVFLFVECYDKDMMGKDKIGTVHIPLDQIEDGTRWYPLKTSHDTPAGQVLLHFGANPPPPSEEADEAVNAAAPDDAAAAPPDAETPAEPTDAAPPPPTDDAPAPPIPAGEPVAAERTESGDGSDQKSDSVGEPAATTADAADADATDSERGTSLDGNEGGEASRDVSLEGPPADAAAAAAAAAPAAPAAVDGPPSIDITVHSARNLLVKDSGGKNDPYCELKLEDAKGKSLQSEKTEVLKNTEVPVWDAVFQFEDTEKAKALRVDVYDKDMIGSNFIGRVTIPVDELRAAAGQKWYKLMDKKGRSEAGEVSLTALRGSLHAKARKGGMLGSFKGAVSGTVNAATSGVRGVGTAVGTGVTAVGSGVTKVASTGANAARSGATAGVNAARSGASAGVKGVTGVASAGARGVGTVAGAGVRGVGTVASAGARGVGGAASLGVRGVTGVAGAGVRGVTGVAGAGMRGVRGVGTMVGDGVRGVAGVAGFGAEEEGASLDVDEATRVMRRRRAIQKELEKDKLAEFKEFLSTLRPDEKNWLKGLAATIVVYFLLKLSVGTGISLTTWVLGAVFGYVLALLGYE